MIDKGKSKWSESKLLLQITRVSMLATNSTSKTIYSQLLLLSRAMHLRLTSLGYPNQRLRSRSSKSRIISWYPRIRTKSTILAATPTQSPVQFKFLLRRMFCYISLQPLPCWCCPSKSPGALHKHLQGNLARDVENQWPLPSSNSRTQCGKLKLKRIGQHS